MSPVTLRKEIGVLDSTIVLKTPDLTYGGTVGIIGSDKEFAFDKDVADLEIRAEIKHMFTIDI